MLTKSLGTAAQADFSLLGMFWQAGVVVQITMLLLIAASIWSWSIAIQKHLSFRAARRRIAEFEAAFWSGEPLDEYYVRIADNPRGDPEAVFCAGMAEWQRSLTDAGGLIPGVQQRIERAMDVAISRAADRMTTGLGVLASVGATTPFVGLFGTVWGIMTVFGEIGVQQNTTLAVVAPGISEALAATALGLMAAIPAVIFYNALSAEAERLTGAHEAFADEFSTLLSRQLDG
ncbi:MAG: protein TolQ [Rhodobacteraceae bacterium]|nr:protein TolQ [Paracoccaceae bacterium]